MPEDATEPAGEDEDCVKLCDGDLWVFLDNGRHGLQSHLLGALRPLAKISRTLHIVYNEDAILSRRSELNQIAGLAPPRKRGFMTIRQVEQATFVTPCPQLLRFFL